MIIKREEVTSGRCKPQVRLDLYIVRRRRKGRTFETGSKSKEPVDSGLEQLKV